MTVEDVARSPRGRIPEPDRRVARCGRDLLPVWRECHPPNPSRMTFENACYMPIALSR